MIGGFLRRVLALMKKEFITIWKDPKTKGIILGLPLMQLLIFSNAAIKTLLNLHKKKKDKEIPEKNFFVLCLQSLYHIPEIPSIK